MKQAALAVATALEQVEAQLTELDAKAGDGDLGASMVRGAAAIRALPDSTWATPATALSGIGDAVRRAIAGSSGPFYATALLRAARALGDAPQPPAAAWDTAFAAAVATIGVIGGARPGDRTMLDARAPALAAWQAARQAGEANHAAWLAAVATAEAGAAASASMLPKLGRASYLGTRALGVPDGGAVAVSVWMRALSPFVH
jgi:dihydroxyacetone kinase